jgi:hypothetical protein
VHPITGAPPSRAVLIDFIAAARGVVSLPAGTDNPGRS